MKRRSAVALLVAVVAPAATAAQLTPPATGGVVELDRLLQTMAQPRRVLMIGAHPDDEDTGLLARVALGDGARAAYLSLSRGEGGQNLIGNELGTTLGLLRTRELESARRLDGAEQYFTRAFDFGYTRSLDETASKWPLDSLLKDVIRVVRRFRPHIIVSVFSGTARDGHGQHQAAGVSAINAFEAAGDAARFPELATEEGLSPWTPLKLYRSTRFDQAATDAALATGELDGRSGRSYHQIAMASRSQHRSQDMGMLQATGPQRSSLRLLSNRTAAPDSADFFSGIEVDAGDLGRLADSLRSALSPSRLSALVPVLAAAVQRFGVDDRAPLLHRALAIAAGLVFDVTADDADLVPGQALAITATVYNGGSEPVRIQGGTIGTPAAWSASGQPLEAAGAVLGPGELWETEAALTVPNQGPSGPYFLERPPSGSMYDWDAVDPPVRGLPFEPPLLEGRVAVSVAGATVLLRREVAYRYRDQAIGEIRHAVRVVPLVDVTLTPARLVWPIDQFPTRTFTATLTYNGTDSYHGRVAVGSVGWPEPPSQPFAFARTGESRQFDFVLSPPPGVADTTVTVRAVATGADGQTFTMGVNTVAYGHIRPAHWVGRAESDVVLSSVVLPAVGRIGYVRGAADRTPEALTQVGMAVELLGPDHLEGADLSAYDVIVIGSRAYEAEPALRRHNDRLLDYSRNGGHLVVQYQQYAFVRGGYAPYPLTIGRPHDRVTDETAPVTILDPNHPVFRGPNRLGPDDWVGWPQERGLYFAQTWDDAYQPLLETHDPGRAPLRGGMLYAEYGAGTYVYTGLSFFRALPGGNPGAFKLFLNLVGARRSAVP